MKIKLNSLQTNINLLMIFAGVLGYVIILLLFFFENIFTNAPAINTNGEQQNLFYNNHPTYLLLLANAMLQGVVWCILIFPATAIISRIKNEFGTEYRIWPTFVVLLIAFLIVAITSIASISHYLSPPASPYNHGGVKDLLFISTALLMGLYFLLGIVMVGRKCLDKMEHRDYDVSDYRRLRGYQDLLMNFTALILTLGVISSILFHKAFIESGSEAKLFPPEFSIMFGFINTLLLLIFYLPNYFIMLDYGKRIIENKFPIENEKKEVILVNVENQNNLSKSLKVDLTVTESIKKTLLILSPLLSGLLPKVLELFGK
ncbi:MAG TPA: hypothetical protein VE978_22555 [Chitinophagales bacterium]|nr:hypothetical protein [Chitinophagales bacterium]